MITQVPRTKVKVATGQASDVNYKFYSQLFKSTLALRRINFNSPTKDQPIENHEQMELLMESAKSCRNFFTQAERNCSLILLYNNRIVFYGYQPFNWHKSRLLNVKFRRSGCLMQLLVAKYSKAARLFLARSHFDIFFRKSTLYLRKLLQILSPSILNMCV